LKTRFLLADDDGDDAELFCEALIQIDAGIECRMVDNGKKLFELLLRPDGDLPDIIFLDINMPIVDGWECLKGLKENRSFSHIPVVMYSTSSAKKDVERAYNSGALVFLTKPEDFDELCEILKIVAVHPIDSILHPLSKFTSVKMPQGQRL
jgi:CheY-like chemotaxis protein